MTDDKKTDDTNNAISTDPEKERSLILTERRGDESRAMSSNTRMGSRMSSMFNTHGDVEAQAEKKKQFKLSWKHSKTRSFGKCKSLADLVVSLLNISDWINNSIVYCLEWAFESSFTYLVFSFILVFFGLACFFAFLIWIASDSYPECLSTNKDESYWQDSFALSWTTFSTVGYGHIYPALAEGNEQSRTCGWIISICAIEAFLGVLYAGLCAAILFAKIYRIQAIATVRFSKALTISYGGVHDKMLEDGEDESSIALPVLSIMLVNTQANKAFGGELFDAKLSAVVTQKSDIKAIDTESAKGKKGIFNRKKQPKKMNTLKAISTVCGHEHLSFVKAEHYLFNRVWVVEHVLDENSPLLKATIREEMKLQKKKMDGISSWPSHLNSAKGVRDSLEPFENLVVSLSATSNSSAMQVYGHEVYDFKSSIVVGYEHADVAYVEGDTKLVGIDFELIDDIVEAGEGLGEDLSNFLSQY